MTRRLQILLYAGFTVLCLFLAALWTFPYDAVGRRLEAETAKASPGTTLVVGDIGPAFPLGVKLERILLAQPRADGGEGTKIEIDSVRLKPAWMKLVTGKAGLAFDLGVLGGEVSGVAAMSRSGNELSATLDGLQLDSGGLLEKASGLQLLGATNGRVRLVTDDKGAITNGEIIATIDGGKVKGGKIAGFAIPPLDLGTPEVEITIENGEAKIAKLEAKSSDLDLAITGNVSMRPQLMQSMIKGNARLKFTDAWLDKNGSIKGMLSLAGSFRKPDGALEVPLNGPLARPANLMGAMGGGGIGNFRR